MKRVKYWGRIGFMSLVIFLVCRAEARASFPRGVNWRQIKTEHFTIVFTEQHREVADYVAAMTESIQQQVARVLDYPAKGNISVVVADYIDQADLLTVAALRSTVRNRIVLLLSSNISMMSSMNLPAKHWMSAQFISQYANILRHQPDNRVRTIFSHLFSSAGFAGWMTGGIGLYQILKLQDQLGHFPFLDMFMRTELLEKDLTNLAQQSAVGSKKWPGDLGMFLYGYAFLLYLSDTYGEERFVELTHIQNAAIPIPGVDPLEKVYGKSLEEIQQDWLADLQNYYQQQVEQIRQQPVTPMTPLSDTGYFTGAPVFAPDGASVYYIEDTPHKDRGIVRLRLSDQQKIRLTDGNLSGDFSVSPDGQHLYFGKTDHYKIYYHYSDLYRLDLATHTVTRLTWGERAFDPVLAPDGHSLVYVTTGSQVMTVKRLDLTTGQHTVLLEPTELGTQIRRPAFSSDGSTLAVQMTTMDGAGDAIYLMNADGSHLRPLLKDDANDSAPVWSLNDDYLFLSSDRGGVLNIFAYAFAEGRLYQVTNALTGVLHPSISPTGEAMVVERYSSQGTDVYLTELTPHSWTPIAETPLQPPSPSEPLPQVTTSREAGYRSFSTLRPGILPALGTDEGGLQIGVLLRGADILKQREYSLTALYGVGSDRFGGNLEYRYNRFRTTFGLFAYDRADKYGHFFITPEGEEPYWQQRQGGGAVLEYPFYRSRKTELLGALEYEYRTLSDLSKDELEQAIPQPDTGALSDVAIALLWKRLNHYRYSVSPESGFLGFIDYRHYDKALGGDYNIDTVDGDLHVYLNSFFKHHVLMLRGAGGFSAGDRLTQGMFQLGGFLFEVDSDVFKRPNYYLRGYDDRTFRGDRFVLGSAEYRFPVWYPERASMGGLLYWNHIGLTLFGDVGDAWEEELRRLTLKYGAGAELNFHIGYWYGKLPFNLDVGVAHGFDELYGETQVYVQMRVETFQY